jgi:hypothetical protein
MVSALPASAMPVMVTVVMHYAGAKAKRHNKNDTQNPNQLFHLRCF